MYHARWIDNVTPCPRCGNRPTLLLYDRSSLCMNCRLHWRPGSVGKSQAKVPLGYVFSSKELSRLRVYRAAVVAGYYSDEIRPGRDLFREARARL